MLLYLPVSVSDKHDKQNNYDQTKDLFFMWLDSASLTLNFSPGPGFLKALCTAIEQIILLGLG